uniref:DSBA-like thioredoxin domain-containing protein n=1 Tax=Mastacembelus armatus TaxID=205130 RepID=A0A7N8WP78_9TELE
LGPNPTVVELFYDVVSPYSWLGFEVMCRYRNLWNIDLKLRPALLGGVMQGSDNKPPAMVQNKFLYMDKDLRRLAGYFDVPLQPPSDPFLYPFGDRHIYFNEGQWIFTFITEVCLLAKETENKLICKIYFWGSYLYVQERH